MKGLVDFKRQFNLLRQNFFFPRRTYVNSFLTPIQDCMPCTKNAHLDSEVLNDVSNLTTDKKPCAGIAAKGLRTAKCEEKRNDFADDHLTTTESVIDETVIEEEPQEPQTPHVECVVSKLEGFKRHSILGKGAFGQVWLVSVPVPGGKREIETPYALKIQSKHELVVSGQAKGSVREANIMSALNHPFLLRSVKAFHDENFLYMLLSYVAGGELYNRVHTETVDGLPESEARFYAAAILEALAFMHRKNIVYRDLKPENVLIDKHGYPVIIDFGLATHVEEKIYTRCGSPCYMAPEVAMVNVGYGIGVDYWSLGCLIHEMVTGETPFVGHVTELALYKAICSGYSHIHPLLEDKAEALDLVQRLLEVDPSKRLGASLAGGGPMDVFGHLWFDDIDFALLRNRGTPAPWVPTIKNDFDASNFKHSNDLQDMTTTNYPELSKDDQALFSSFGKSNLVT